MLNQLKPDILMLIEISNELGKYNEMLLHHNNLSDKRNYDAEKCVKIKTKITELQIIFYSIKKHWGLKP